MNDLAKQKRNKYMRDYYHRNKDYQQSAKDRAKARREAKNFGGNRELAIKRDKYSCVCCGITRNEHVKKFNVDITVDHIDGRGKNAVVKNNNLSNLQTLCLSCHGKKDYKYQSRKLTDEDIRDIRMFKNSGLPASKIARAYQMLSVSTVQRAAHGATWGGVV